MPAAGGSAGRREGGMELQTWAGTAVSVAGEHEKAASEASVKHWQYKDIKQRGRHQSAKDDNRHGILNLSNVCPLEKYPRELRETGLCWGRFVI